MLNAIERRLMYASEYAYPSFRFLFLSIYIRRAYIREDIYKEATYKEELPYIETALKSMVNDVAKMVTDDGYNTRPVEIDASFCGEKAEELFKKLADKKGYPPITK